MFYYFLFVPVLTEEQKETLQLLVDPTERFFEVGTHRIQFYTCFENVLHYYLKWLTRDFVSNIIQP